MGYTHQKYTPPLTFTLPNSTMTYMPNFIKMTQKASINDLENFSTIFLPPNRY